MARPINYLNNKDILKELHKSKNTYCAFASPEVSNYDIILTDVKDIVKKTEQGREARAFRIATELYEKDAGPGAINTKSKISEYLPDISTIEPTDVVFRVMTSEHIPFAPKRKKEIAEDELLDDIEEPTEKSALSKTKKIRINFPAFQHFKVNENIEPVCVGKSHWKNGLNPGEFSQTHGTMTPTLANMFIKLCDRYATRSNWRGYSYNDEMKSDALLQLSYVGLSFDESKGDNPFAYYTLVVQRAFTKILLTEKKNQRLRDDLLELNNYNPSSTRQDSWGSGFHDD